MSPGTSTQKGITTEPGEGGRLPSDGLRSRPLEPPFLPSLRTPGGGALKWVTRARMGCELGKQQAEGLLEQRAGARQAGC